MSSGFSSSFIASRDASGLGTSPLPTISPAKCLGGVMGSEIDTTVWHSEDQCIDVFYTSGTPTV
jgi:hypothetical protein